MTGLSTGVVELRRRGGRKQRQLIWLARCLMAPSSDWLSSAASGSASALTSLLASTSRPAGREVNQVALVKDYSQELGTIILVLSIFHTQ